MPPRHGSSAGSEDGSADSVPNGDGATAPSIVDVDREDPDGPHLDPRQASPQNWTSRRPGASVGPPRRIDVNAPGNPAVHVQAGPLHLATRIIAACPLADTLAILIVLLQLPPALLTVVQFLYAALTFVHHSAPSLSLGPFSDFFDSAGVMPSMGTIVLADLAVFVAWLLLWNPAQNLALELAQAVIAASLGGRYDDGDAGPRNTVICASFVMLAHLGRTKSQKSSLRPPLASAMFPDFDSMQPVLLAGQSTPSVGRTWARVLTGLHILAQGSVVIFRRWLPRRNMGGLSQLTNKMNTESSRGTESYMDDEERINTALEPPADPGTDTRRSGSEFTAKDAKELGSGMKTQERQNVNVRAYQPFWAAVASTKSVVLKEYEHSQASAEAVGARAKDVDHLGNAPFRAESGRIWVTRVGSTEILFQSSLIGTQSAPAKASDHEQESLQGSREEMHAAKPFYVRVNDADWPSTRIFSTAKEEGDNDSVEGQWVAEVSGLTPGFSYTCEFRGTRDDQTLYRLNLTTQHISSAETGKAFLRTLIGMNGD